MSYNDYYLPPLTNFLAFWLIIEIQGSMFVDLKTPRSRLGDCGMFGELSLYKNDNSDNCTFKSPT